MNPEFYKLVRQLVLEGRDSDFEVVCAAREAGFDPDDVWRACCEVMNFDSDRRWRQDVGRIASELRDGGGSR